MRVNYGGTIRLCTNFTISEGSPVATVSYYGHDSISVIFKTYSDAKQAHSCVLRHGYVDLEEFDGVELEACASY